MSILTAFGLVAVTTVMLFYWLEDRWTGFTLAFGLSCLALWDRGDRLARSGLRPWYRRRRPLSTSVRKRYGHWTDSDGLGSHATSRSGTL